MDIDMPIKNGFQATKEIKSLTLDPMPFISACSAFKGTSDKNKAKQSGMDYFLEKPLQK